MTDDSRARLIDDAGATVVDADRGPETAPDHEKRALRPTGGARAPVAAVAQLVRSSGAGIWIALLVLGGVATLTSHGVFLHGSNLINILVIAAPIGIAALGQTLVILTAGIDLSVASTWILAGVVGGSLVTSGSNVGIAVAVALAAGVVVGIANGSIVAVLRIPPLITTLGMLAIVEAIARIYRGNQPILSLPNSYTVLAQAKLGPFPLPVIVWLTVLLAIAFVMSRTTLGRAVYAVGGNPEAARFSGLPVIRTLVIVYAISGALAALGGMLSSAYLNLAVPNADLTTLFDIVAGAVIGGTSLFGGEGRALNTVAGVLVIVMTTNLMNILGISPLLEQGVLGAVIVIAVALNAALGSRAGDRPRQRGV